MRGAGLTILTKQSIDLQAEVDRLFASLPYLATFNETVNEEFNKSLAFDRTTNL